MSNRFIVHTAARSKRPAHQGHGRHDLSRLPSVTAPHVDAQAMGGLS